MTGILAGKVTRDANMVPSLTMTYQANNYLADEVQSGRVIMTDCGQRLKRQLFRITKITKRKADNGELTLEIEGTHIIGDLAYNLISEDFKSPTTNAVNTFEGIKKRLVDPMPQLTFKSDIASTANINWAMLDVKSVMDLFVSGNTQAGDIDNTMQGLFNGDLQFNNYEITQNKTSGEDTGLVIKYGDDLRTVDQETAIAQTYTAVRPRATYTVKPKSDLDPDKDKQEQEAEREKLYEPVDGIGLVQYVGAGGVSVYDSPWKGHKELKKLPNGSYWKIFRKLPSSAGGVNDDEWIDLGGDQWVDARYLTIEKDGSYVTNDFTGIGTIKYTSDSENSSGNGIYTEFTGVAEVYYIGLDNGTYADIFDQPGKNLGKVVGHLKNGDYYKVSKKYTDINSDIWYELGADQWIQGNNLSFDIENAYIVNKTTKGLGIIKPYKVEVPEEGKELTDEQKEENEKNRPKAFTTPGFGKQLEPYVDLYAGSQWVVNKSAKVNDETWYEIGTDIWVNGTYFDFESQGTVKPHELTPDSSSTPQISGEVVVYDQPGLGKKPTGKTLPSGSQWKILGEAKSGNETWYKVGGGEWVNSVYFNFDGPTDVMPAGDEKPNTENDNDPTDPGGDGSGVTEEQQITVTLPESIVKTPEADSYERLRIVDFDASDYNVQDEATLRKVTQDYISDYEIGKPVVSLTITREQMTGRLAKLETVDLYDTATIYFKPLGIFQKTRVNHTEWDIPSKRYSSLTFGEPPKDLTHYLAELKADLEKDAQDKADKAESSSNNQAHQQLDDSKIDFQGVIDETSDTLVKRIVKNNQDLQTALNENKDNIKSYVDEHGKDMETAINNLVESARTDLNGKILDLQHQDSDYRARLETIRDTLGIKAGWIDPTDNKLSTYDTTLNELNTSLIQYRNTVTNISNWLDSGGTSEIRAYPNWEHPRELWAMSNAGGYMKFNNAGLGYYSGTGGLVRTAITSDGKISAENITGLEGKFQNLDGVNIRGRSYIYMEGNGNHIEMSYTNGLSTNRDVAVGHDLSVGNSATFSGKTQVDGNFIFNGSHGLTVGGVGMFADGTGPRIYYENGEFKINDGKHGSYVLYSGQQAWPIN
jgi:hypothetical protein